MSVYSGEVVFDMARRRFAIVADHICMPEGDRDRMLYPKRWRVLRLYGRTAKAANVAGDMVSRRRGEPRDEIGVSTFMRADVSTRFSF